jgi:hypothetical protein
MVTEERGKEQVDSVDTSGTFPNSSGKESFFQSFRYSWYNLYTGALALERERGVKVLPTVFNMHENFPRPLTSRKTFLLSTSSRI